MKRLFILAIGLGLVSSNTYTAPFYKVQCYDSKYNVVSCDDKAKVAKSKKIARVFKKKTVKKETASERKARERAMALRELAKQNETLKTELDSLRKANLIASAKTSEVPTTAQAAPVVQASVPAPATTPMPTAATQIAKSVDTEEKSVWGFEATNYVFKSFNSTVDDKKNSVSSPLQNELDLIVKYMPTSSMSFGAEEDIYWNWANTTNAANNGFALDNPSFCFDYFGLYVSENKQTTVDGEIRMVPGIKQKSRDAGMVAQFYFKSTIKSKFNDGKGYFKFEPEIVPIINKYSTSSPKATSFSDDMFMIGDVGYERLSPNTRFAMDGKVSLGHKLMEGVTLEASAKFTSANTFADEFFDSSGINHTITPAGWSNSTQIRFPAVIIGVSDRFTVIARLEADCGDLAKGFKPYAVDDNNSLAFFFIMDYAI